MSDPEGKALAFNSCVRELRSLSTADSFARLVAALPAPTRALVEHPPFPLDWLPYTHSFSLVRQAHQLVFAGDYSRTAEISRRAVRADMSMVHKLFIRLASPEFVIGRAARLWETYWRNNGTVRIEAVAARSVLVHYEGMRHATRLFWEMQCGTVRGLIEATGFARRQVHIAEGHDSTSHCVVSATWE